MSSCTLKRPVILGILLFLFVPVLSAQQAQSVANSGSSSRESALLIGPGDLLHLSLLGAPEFERDVRVSERGEISLPMVGVISVGSLTVAEAEHVVAGKLTAGGYFTDPQVTILIKEYATQGVSVLGEVQKPGVYPVLGPRRLFDAISAAGGLTSKAGRTVAITHRNDPEHAQRLQLGDDLQASTASNAEIYPGDTIVVSKAGIVYVVGDVKMPGGFVMERGDITVLQALALAQGANPTASLNAARLIRSSGAAHEEQAIQLKKILMAKAPDVKLQPDDILFIPNSLGKSAVRRGLEAVLQTASGVAIYRPY